jgi:hypothetical protein
MQKPFPHDPEHWRLRAEEARVHSELIGDPDSRIVAGIGQGEVEASSPGR